MYQQNAMPILLPVSLGQTFPHTVKLQSTGSSPIVNQQLTPPTPQLHSATQLSNSCNGSRDMPFFPGNRTLSPNASISAVPFRPEAPATLSPSVSRSRLGGSSRSAGPIRRRVSEKFALPISVGLFNILLLLFTINISVEFTFKKILYTTFVWCVTVYK